MIKFVEIDFTLTEITLKMLSVLLWKYDFGNIAYFAIKICIYATFNGFIRMGPSSSPSSTQNIGKIVSGKVFISLSLGIGPSITLNWIFLYALIGVPVIGSKSKVIMCFSYKYIIFIITYTIFLIIKCFHFTKKKCHNKFYFIIKGDKSSKGQCTTWHLSVSTKHCSDWSSCQVILGKRYDALLKRSRENWR